MATAPKFVSTPRIGITQVSTANTNRDGTGTTAAVLTGVAAGTRVERVIVQATGTTTAGWVRLFLSTDGGTTKRLLREVAITAATPSTTVAAFNTEIDFSGSGLVLPDASAQLIASTHNAETFNVIAYGGDLT